MAALVRRLGGFESSEKPFDCSRGRIGLRSRGMDINKFGLE